MNWISYPCETYIKGSINFILLEEQFIVKEQRIYCVTRDKYCNKMKLSKTHTIQTPKNSSWKIKIDENLAYYF